MNSRTPAPTTLGLSRFRVALAVVAAFTVPAVLTASQQFYSMRSEGQPIRWTTAVTSQLTFWYAWGAMTPLIVWTLRAMTRLTRGLVARFAMIVAWGIATSLLHSALMFFIRVMMVGPPPGMRAPSFIVFARSWLPLDLIMYSAIVCASYAAENYGRFRERELAASELAAQLSRAQLRALRMQLHPHFLFNALNSIAMLVRKGEDGQAVKMLVGLSDLLRHVLDDEAENEVPLRSELAFLERYMAIEQTRFQDRLRVRVDVDAALLDARVPNLILQPLVENAIRHGIAQRAAAGALEIVAARSDGTLSLSVSDDGPGLARATPAPDGVGLRNTRERLAQLYGDRASLTLGDNAAGGARATVTIPYHTAPFGDYSRP